MIRFIADLHLAQNTPQVTSLFLHFIQTQAQHSESLYVLGDLFDTWVGDEEVTSPWHATIISALRDLSTHGVKLYVMHGNRDFLLGTQFASATGAQLIKDPYILSLPSGQFVLSHGDMLCTDDTDYQTLRHQIRSQAWQTEFLAKPLTERQTIAKKIRQQSEQSKQGKSLEIMDLNPTATEDFLRQQGYATFIHGHTHRPARHEYLIDGIYVERWVLSDWHDTHAECLSWDGEQLQREPITFNRAATQHN